jgi:melibiose permease
MACNLTNSAQGSYFLFVVGDTGREGLINLVKGGAQGIGLFLFPLISARLGRGKVYSGTLLLPCLGYAAMALAYYAAPTTGVFLPLAAATAVAFVGYGSMSVMQSVMLADGVDYGEYETGYRNEGIIFSMLTMLSKLAGAFSSLVSTTTYMLVKFGGKYPNDPTPLAQKGISFLMFALPPVLLLCAYALYRGCYKLSPARMAQVKEELAARKREGA